MSRIITQLLSAIRRQAGQVETGDVAGVAPGASSTLISLTADEVDQLVGFLGTGERDGYFWVEVNGSRVISDRTTAASPKAEAFLPYPDPLASGDTVELLVENEDEKGVSSDYEGTLVLVEEES